jgi:hypothetical protein
LPQPNTNDYTAGKSNADADGHGNDHTTSIANGHGNSNSDGNNHTTTTFTDTDADADAASADAKAAANAVPTADAVSEWVKKLNELQSNRELARQLASSLLLRESATRHADASWSAAPKASEATFKNVLVDNRREIVADVQGVVLKPNLPTKHTKRHQNFGGGCRQSGSGHPYKSIP